MRTLKLFFRNAFRHKLRTGLTVLGITIAILAFGMLRTMVNAWYAGVEASSANRLVIRNAISLVFPLPLAYKDKIRQVGGVTLVSWGNWFGGVYIEEKNFFPNFAVDPRSFLGLYPEYLIPDMQRASFLSDRKGAVAGKKVADKFGWKVGDTVTLKGTIFPGNWEFTIRAIYRGKDRSVDETQFFFHWDYLDETMKKTTPRRAGQVGYYIIGIANPNLAGEVSAAIDATFKNSLAETLTETEKAFQMSFVSMTEAILVAIQLVSIVIIVIIMAVVANTMAMTARERIGEYAVFKTLGFGGWFIAGLIFGESLFISLLGTAVGIGLTFPVAAAFADYLGTYFPIFFVEKETVLMDLAAGVLVGVVAALFPTWRAVRIRIADG
ncbi:MAG: FtsX-like permease family protein, partial [Syntrophales bacterium]|nr:FtsX-like permease family protein [Syntrophales bacterium]